MNKKPKFDDNARLLKQLSDVVNQEFRSNLLLRNEQAKLDKAQKEERQHHLNMLSSGIDFLASLRTLGDGIHYVPHVDNKVKKDVIQKTEAQEKYVTQKNIEGVKRQFRNWTQVAVATSRGTPSYVMDTLTSEVARDAFDTIAAYEHQENFNLFQLHSKVLMDEYENLNNIQMVQDQIRAQRRASNVNTFASIAKNLLPFIF